MTRERFYFEETCKKKLTKPLHKNIKCEFLVIGGGITGLTIAYFLKQKRKDVVVIDKGYIGQYASGRSSGFLTQNTELDLYQIEKSYGKEKAKKLWGCLGLGIQIMKEVIKKNKIDCDYEVQPSLYLAIKNSHVKILKEEKLIREELLSKSHFLTRGEVSNYINSKAFYAALLSKEDCSINAFKYINNLKSILIKNKVKIYENTEALEINNNFIKTKNNKIYAKQIILANDHFAKNMGYFKNDILRIKTSVAITEKIRQKLIKNTFKKGKMLLWDTKKVYNYLRLLPDNRLLVAGGDIEVVQEKGEETYEHKPYKDLRNYLDFIFPELKNIDFQYKYSGVIGRTTDFFPIVGKINDNDNLSFCLCSAGLPLSTFSAKYLVDKLLGKREDFDEFFSPRRKFSKITYIESLLGEKLFDYFADIYLKILNFLK